MDFELPNLLSNMSNYQKRFNIKSNLYLKHIFDRSVATYNKESKTYINQTVLDARIPEQEQLPTLVQKELPAISRNRSPSVGNAFKQLGMLGNDSLKAMEPSERTISPLKNRYNSSLRKEMPSPGLMKRNHSISYKESEACDKLQEMQDQIDAVLERDNFQFSRGLRKQSVPTLMGEHDQSRIRNYSMERKNPPSVMLNKVQKEFSMRDLVFGPNVTEATLNAHVLAVVQGVRYALKQLKPQPISQLEGKQVLLRDDPVHKKTLVLDLDETLITTKKTENVKERLPSIDGSDESGMRVRVRPYAVEFLKEMSKEFEIIIFTAAEKRYAEAVLKTLDPEQSYISYLFHRDHCLKTRKGLCIKDLRIFKNRELKDMVIVDNFTPSFSFQIDNGIPIITWEGDAKDQELKYLMKYLLEAKKYNDMRLYNKEMLRLEELASLTNRKFSDD